MKTHLRYLPFIIAAVLITVFIYRSCNKTDPIYKPIDTSAYDRSADSLQRIMGLHADSAKLFKSQRDSAKKALANSHKKVKHEIQIVKNLPPAGLSRFHDSLMRSIGFR